MSRSESIVRGLRVLCPDGIHPAAIHIAGGTITAVTDYDDIPREARPALELSKPLIMPGLVDSHVHVNEPGRTEWEGYDSATRAAAAGGITTIVDMPLNSIPPTTTLSGLETKRAAAEGKCWVDVGFWGGVVPGNTAELVPMIEAGVCGFKCFLVPSGVDEFAHVTESDLLDAMPRTGDAGVPLLVHAELPGPIEAAERAVAQSSRLSYLTYLASRPNTAEDEAIALMVGLCERTRAPVHIVHHASSTSIPVLEAARGTDLPITAETCPHYLHFCAEDIPDGGTQYKCAPPIRERDNREKLWELGLRSGALSMVVSDHSPCTPELKRLSTGDFIDAWGGIASVQLTLAAVWTEARKRGDSLEQLATWMCEAPARLAGLADRKGAIAPGFDADLVIWEPETGFVVAGDQLFHRHPVTPYDGELLYGKVSMTMLRGEIVYDGGRLVGAPRGQLLRRA